MCSALTEQLVMVAQAARRAGHGEKGAIYANACRELGLSMATLMRKIKEVSVTPLRKRRSDAGQTALTRDEAMIISALLIESMRKNGKRLYSVGDAIEALRANGMIRAEHVDANTGEIRPLSDATIHRSLRVYGLHPDQLLAPAPCVELSSAHPNEVWQIDASLCVMYYLRPGADAQGNGLRVMDHKQFYKNKPKNVLQIALERVWSYEITDHASGWIYVEYVLGAESGANLNSVLINAMQERGGSDVLHGVPRKLYMDPGSAGTASMTRNMGDALGIELLVHKAGNARATGQVENARNIIERKFEPALKFQPVHSLEELNAQAAKWRAHFNATAVHRRHGMTRSACWLKFIRESQLIKAPSVEVCREVAVSTPKACPVSDYLRVNYKGAKYDVSAVPGVMVGAKLMVTRNPWRDDAAQVVLYDADGHKTYLVVPKVEKNELGFSLNAQPIGEGFRRHADTPAQDALKEIELLVTGTTTGAEAEAARKAKEIPFSGRFDPYKHIDDAELPAYMPRRGTAHSLVAPTVELPPLSRVEAAKVLKPRVEAVGTSWTADHMGWLAQRFPDGVPQDQLDALVAELTRPAAGATPALTLLKSA